MLLFLKNRLEIVFFTHTWCALSVFFCDGNFLLEAVGILSLSSYSWTLELGCFVRHAWFALPVFSRDAIFLLEAVGILRLFLDNWIADCLVCNWKVTNLIESMIHKRVVFSCVAVNKYF